MCVFTCIAYRKINTTFLHLSLSTHTHTHTHTRFIHARDCFCGISSQRSSIFINEGKTLGKVVGESLVDLQGTIVIVKLIAHWRAEKTKIIINHHGFGECSEQHTSIN